MNGAKRNAYRILVGKPERPLGRPKLMCEGNIKMDFKEMIGWTGLTSLRVGTSGGLL
jgi:hypothetical protein